MLGSPELNSHQEKHHSRDQSDPRGNGECRTIRRLFHKEAKRQYPYGKRNYETRDSNLPLSFHASNGRSERRAKRVRSSAGLANTVDTQWPSSVHTK